MSCSDSTWVSLKKKPQCRSSRGRSGAASGRYIRRTIDHFFLFHLLRFATLSAPLVWDLSELLGFGNEYCASGHISLQSMPPTVHDSRNPSRYLTNSIKLDNASSAAWRKLGNRRLSMLLVCWPENNGQSRIYGTKESLGMRRINEQIGLTMLRTLALDWRNTLRYPPARKTDAS